MIASPPIPPVAFSAPLPPPVPARMQSLTASAKTREGRSGARRDALPTKLLDTPEPCRGCGQLCWTIKLGGRVPLHPSCDTRHALDAPTPEQLVAAITVLTGLIGPVVVSPPEPPTRPEEVGPCMCCGRPIRRYGAWARSRCAHCPIGVDHDCRPTSLVRC